MTTGYQPTGSDAYPGLAGGLLPRSAPLPTNFRTGMARFTTRVRPGNVPPPLLMLFGMVSTQVGAAVAKQLFTSAGAVGTAALRLALGALVLLVLVRPMVRFGWRTAGLVSAFGVAMAGMNLAFYTALERVPLGVAVTIGFAGPLLVSLAASRQTRDIAWVALAGGGVALLAGFGGGGPDRLGLLLCGLVALGWAGYVLLGKAVGDRVGAADGLTLGMLVGAICVLPMGVASSGSVLLDPWTLALAGGVAVLSSVLPYSAEMAALRRMPARVFAILLSLEPAVAAAVGVTLLDEAPSWRQLAGVGCVVGASLGATLRPTRLTRPPARAG